MQQSNNNIYLMEITFLAITIINILYATKTDEEEISINSTVDSVYFHSKYYQFMAFVLKGEYDNNVLLFTKNGMKSFNGFPLHFKIL